MTHVPSKYWLAEHQHTLKLCVYVMCTACACHYMYLAVCLKTSDLHILN